MWSRVQSWVEILCSHTLRGRADGLWAVHTWLAGSDGDAVHDVVGALRSVIPADGGRTFATSSLTCTHDVVHGIPVGSCQPRVHGPQPVGVGMGNYNDVLMEQLANDGDG